jgi:UDPglucose 6-dehydrogenase
MLDEIRRICCIGAGYVGAPTMAVFAKHLPHVTITVLDKDEQRVKAWNSGNKLPLFEPQLEVKCDILCPIAPI